jgi:hypothetical protein
MSVPSLATRVHALIFTPADIPFAHRQQIAVDPAAAIKIPAIVHVGQIVDGIIEKAVVA